MPVSSGRFRAAATNLFTLSVRNCRSAARTVFQHEGHATRSADAGDRRRRKGKRRPSCTFDKRLRDMRADGMILLFRFLALVPRLLGHEEECAVGVLHPAQEAEADHRRAALHARRMQNDVFHLPCRRAGALQGSGVRQLQTRQKRSPDLRPAETRWAACRQAATAETARPGTALKPPCESAPPRTGRSLRSLAQTSG